MHGREHANGSLRDSEALFQHCSAPRTHPHRGAAGVLKIRQQQVAALRDCLKVQFADRVVQQLRADMPRRLAELRPGEAKAKVLLEIDNARRYGLGTEREVFRYVALAVAFGADFMRREWALRVLENPMLTLPSERIAGIWHAAPPLGPAA